METINLSGTPYPFDRSPQAATLMQLLHVDFQAVQNRDREELKKYDPDLYELLSHYFSEFKESPSKHKKVNLYKI